MEKLTHRTSEPVEAFNRNPESSILIPVKRSFTLLEIIIVVSIIAMLAAIAVPRLMSSGDDAKVGITKTQISQLASAVARFKIDTNKTPDSLEELVENRRSLKNWKQYLEVVEKDPWGNEYQYQVKLESYNGFDIISYGSDGKPGGSDNASDISFSKKKD